MKGSQGLLVGIACRFVFLSQPIATADLLMEVPFGFDVTNVPGKIQGLVIVRHRLVMLALSNLEPSNVAQYRHDLGTVSQVPVRHEGLLVCLHSRRVVPELRVLIAAFFLDLCLRRR